jgi:hypothetical protein
MDISLPECFLSGEECFLVEESEGGGFGFVEVEYP